MRLSQPSKQLIKALQACMRSAAASTTHLGGVVARSSEAHCYSSNRGSGSASSSGDGNDAAGGGILADFEQRVAAIHKSGGVDADLQAFRRAATQGSVQAAGTPSLASQSPAALRHLPGDEPPRSSSSSKGTEGVYSRVYGYAVLGGVDPEASLREAGMQQPKLHPTRDFRVGDTYSPQDLTPLTSQEEEPWLPRPAGRTATRKHRVPGRSGAAALANYKHAGTLLPFITDAGRLRPRRETGLKRAEQVRVSKSVKLARHMALLPYEMRVGGGGEGDVWRRQRDFRAAQLELSGGSAAERSSDGGSGRRSTPMQ